MSILVYRDRSVLSVAASTLLAAQMIEKPASVLGFDYSEELAPTFRTLSRMNAEGLLDWSEATAFVLSEQVRKDGDSSIVKQLSDCFLDRAGIPQDKRFSPNGTGSDWSVVCNDFENAILNAGGIDFSLLNVCADGSVAYNLGSAELAPVTHVERTDKGRVVTVGMTTLMSSKKLVVVISGADKADIASAIFNGPIIPAVPASYLQLHGNVIFLLDEDAASRI